MSAFIGELVVKLVSDSVTNGVWELQAPLCFRSDLAVTTIVAPIGFQTDFCSVPRVPLAYDMLGNRAHRSGAIHDRIYSTHELPREMADQVLKEMLLLDGVDEFEAQEFYLAVRVGGGSHWGPDPAP